MLKFIKCELDLTFIYLYQVVKFYCYMHFSILNKIFLFLILEINLHVVKMKMERLGTTHESAILRPHLVFTTNKTNFYTPTNWKTNTGSEELMKAGLLHYLFKKLKYTKWSTKSSLRSLLRSSFK